MPPAGVPKSGKKGMHALQVFAMDILLGIFNRKTGHGMHIRSILNRVEKLKGFVYSSEKYVGSGDRPSLEVTVRPRKVAKATAVAAVRKVICGACCVAAVKT